MRSPGLHPLVQLRGTGLAPTLAAPTCRPSAHARSARLRSSPAGVAVPWHPRSTRRGGLDCALSGLPHGGAGRPPPPDPITGPHTAGVCRLWALGTHWVSTSHVPGAVLGIGAQQGHRGRPSLPCGRWHSGGRGDRHTAKHPPTDTGRARAENNPGRDVGAGRRSLKQRLPPTQGGVVPPERGSRPSPSVRFQEAEGGRVADHSRGRGGTGKGGAGGPERGGLFL